MKKHDSNRVDSSLGEEIDHDDYKKKKKKRYFHVPLSKLKYPTVPSEETLCLKAKT